MYGRLLGILSERKYDTIGISSILIAFVIIAFAFALYSKGMYYDYYYDTQYELSEGYTNFHFMEEVGAIYCIWCTTVIAYCYFYGSWDIGKVVVCVPEFLGLLFLASTMADEIVNFHPSSACTQCRIVRLKPLAVVACAFAYAVPFLISIWLLFYWVRNKYKSWLIFIFAMMLLGGSLIISLVLNMSAYFIIGLGTQY